MSVVGECFKTHVEGPSQQCPWCRIDALRAERDELHRKVEELRNALACEMDDTSNACGALWVALIQLFTDTTADKSEDAGK